MRKRKPDFNRNLFLSFNFYFSRNLMMKIIPFISPLSNHVRFSNKFLIVRRIFNINTNFSHTFIFPFGLEDRFEYEYFFLAKKTLIKHHFLLFICIKNYQEKQVKTSNFCDVFVFTKMTAHFLFSFHTLPNIFVSLVLLLMPD